MERKWLKQRRENAGITLEEMANRLDISALYYQLIEGGYRQKRMVPELASRIALVLDLTVEDIFSAEKAM